MTAPPQIWNHPDVLYKVAQKRKKNSSAEDNDIDLEGMQEAGAGTKKAGNKGGKQQAVAPTPVTAAAFEQKNPSSFPKPGTDVNKAFAMMERKDQGISYEWVSQIFMSGCKVYCKFLCVFTLAPREECEGNAFGSVFLSVSVPVRNSKTIAPIDLIFLHKKYYPRGSVLL